MADLDPYQRAIQGGLSLGQTAQAGALDTTQGGFNSALDLFANTGSFNVNRGDSLYNSWLNNATAVKTGNMAASATNNAAQLTAASNRAAGRDAMIGGIASGVPILGPLIAGAGRAFKLW